MKSRRRRGSSRGHGRHRGDGQRRGDDQRRMEERRREDGPRPQEEAHRPEAEAPREEGVAAEAPQQENLPLEETRNRPETEGATDRPAAPPPQRASQPVHRPRPPEGPRVGVRELIQQVTRIKQVLSDVVRDLDSLLGKLRHLEAQHDYQESELEELRQALDELYPAPASSRMTASYAAPLGAAAAAAAMPAQPLEPQSVSPEPSPAYEPPPQDDAPRTFDDDEDAPIEPPTMRVEPDEDSNDEIEDSPENDDSPEEEPPDDDSRERPMSGLS